MYSIIGLLLWAAVQAQDCSACAGKGRVTEPVTCENCKGSGYCRCTACKGTGEIKCKKCQGTGLVRQITKSGGWTRDRKIACEDCGGSEGAVRKGSGKVRCQLCSSLWVCQECKAKTRDRAVSRGACAGCGERRWEQRDGQMDCPKCKATGQVERTVKCRACNGSGKSSA